MLVDANRDPRRGVGKLVLIGCLGAIVLFGAIALLVLVLTASQVKIVEAHLVAMRSKDVDTACKEIDGQHVTKEQVKTILDLNPQVFGSSDVSFPSRKVETVDGQDKAEIVAKIKGTDGKEYTIQYVLLKSGEAWKIAGIRSDDIALAPAALTIQGVDVKQKKLGDGQTEVRIEFQVLGCDSRKVGAKFEYDVSLKGKLVDAAGAVLLEEQELGHYKEALDAAGAPVSGHHKYTLPPNIEGELKATIIVEDVVSGRGVSQVVPVKIGK